MRRLMSRFTDTACRCIRQRRTCGIGNRSAPVWVGGQEWCDRAVEAGLMSEKSTAWTFREYDQGLMGFPFMSSD